MTDIELARNYILDRLSDEDRDECERRFLSDPEFETAMLEQERALLDDYASLRLSGEDAEALLRRAEQEPGHLYRLRIAEGLNRAAAAQSDRFHSPVVLKGRGLFASRRAAWFGSLAAIAALTLVAAVSINLRQRTAPNQPVSASPATTNPAVTIQSADQAKPHAPAQPRQPESAAASMATFVLLANQRRGEGDGTEIALRPGIELLRLQLTTEEGLNPGRYSVTVHDSREAEVFSAADLTTHTESGRCYVDLRIPADQLASGAYTIELTGNAASAPLLSFRFALAASAAAR